MESAKAVDIMGVMPGYTSEQSDAPAAYTQEYFRGELAWIKLPEEQLDPQCKTRAKVETALPRLCLVQVPLPRTPTLRVAWPPSLRAARCHPIGTPTLPSGTNAWLQCSNRAARPREEHCEAQCRKRRVQDLLTHRDAWLERGWQPDWTPSPDERRWRSLPSDVLTVAR